MRKYRKFAKVGSESCRVKHLCWSFFLMKCFPVKIGEYLRTPILKNICKRLLLELFWRSYDGAIFAKTFIKNVLYGPKYTSVKVFCKKVVMKTL